MESASVVGSASTMGHNMEAVDELLLAFTSDTSTITVEAVETLSSLTSSGVCWQRTLILLGFVKEGFEALGVFKAEMILLGLVPETKCDDMETRELLKLVWAVLEMALRRRVSGTQKASRLQRKEDELAKLFFIWLERMLQFRLVPKPALSPLYGLLFELLLVPAFHSTLAPLLATLTTDSEQVSHHRISLLKRLVNDKKKTTVASQLLALAQTFHIANPGLMKKEYPKLVGIRKGLREAATAKRVSRLTMILEAKFGSSRDEESELLNPLRFEANLCWDVAKGSSKESAMVHEPPGKMRKKCFLPAPDLPEMTEGFSLLNCSRVFDVFNNLGRLRDPAQPLSLLKNAGTFFLLGNPSNVPLQRKFSLSLYHYLQQEFFLGDHKDQEERRDHLLRRIDMLQDYLQQGIPVVGHFLTEFFMNWNGSDHFYTALPLICHIQITDFSEVEACLLLPITMHFHTLTPSQRLFFLSVLHKLALNWIILEYPRETKQQQRFFVMADRVGNPVSPLECIDRLLAFFADVVDETHVKLQQHASSDILLSASDRRRHQGLFLSQVTTFYLSICRALLETEVPLRPELPPYILYTCIFDQSSSLLSRVLEYLTIAKHELIPMCQRIYRVKYKPALSNSSRLLHRRTALREEAPLVREQFNELEMLNVITKDARAVLALEKITLDDLSLFRSKWDVDQEDLCINLKMATHPAFLHYALQLSRAIARRKGLSVAEVHASLLDADSDNYFTLVHEVLLESLPNVSGFMATFDPNFNRLKQQNLEHATSTAVSGVTSGIFSAPSNQNNSHEV